MYYIVTRKTYVLKAEYEQSRKINKTASYIVDSIIDFDYDRSSQAFCTCMDFTCILWTLLVKK